MQIDDHALLSDCRSAALVTTDGTVDWLCFPRFDSPSVCAGLLDPEGGSWRIAPRGDFHTSRAYRPETLALETRFLTETGSAHLVDALLLGTEERGHQIGKASPHVLVREVTCTFGEVVLTSRLAARLEYGLTRPRVEPIDDGFTLSGGPVSLQATASVPSRAEGSDVVAEFRLAVGESAVFALAYRPTFAGPPAWRGDSASALRDTEEAWRSWASVHWREQPGYEGLYVERVRNSAIVLQGLSFQPSGAVIAAPTTSLPERMDDGWNWDYRFTWLRDASFMMRSLWVAACPDEPERFFDWIVRAEGAGRDSPVQIVFGVEGERDLAERRLPHLEGFAGRGPVRVGNDAWRQVQLDVLGEVLDTALLLDDKFVEWPEGARELLVAFADRAAAAWREPDAGMWEARDAVRQYTSSKVMCWVALDRAVTLADRLGATEEQRRTWERERDAVHAETLRRAWSERAGAFCGALDSDELDASVLLMPLVGFLPAEDARMRATIAAVERVLDASGPLRRWEGEPNGFLLAGFWLVSCLALLGERERATERFEACCSYANDLGLLAEEVDSGSHTGLGNFPQAFSHVGLINAAWDLTLLERGELFSPATATGARR